jgi:hypothetical protein
MISEYVLYNCKKLDWRFYILLSAVKVVPHSIKHPKNGKPDCNLKDPMQIPSGDLQEHMEIVHTYSVKFVVSIQSLMNSIE